MSITLRTERYSPTQVSQMYGVHICTVWRWMLRGAKGRKLESFSVGGRRFVSKNALDKFIAQPELCVPEKNADFIARASNAGRVLDALGVESR